MTALAPKPALLAQAVDAAAVEALRLELIAYPKPGLVSRIDAGSHTDMTATTFRTSIAALKGYFGEMALAAAGGADFAELNRIGREAEARMFAATDGVNTHRGAVFSLGLLAAAAGVAPPDASAICRTVADRWGDDIRAAGRRRVERSHGAEVRLRYGAPGARDEAAAGFPTVIGHALPTYRAMRAKGADVNDAMVETVFVVIAVLEDNNLLYRGGPKALRDAQTVAIEYLASGGILSEGGRIRAVAAHTTFIENRWSPGGAADLLAATMFLAAIEDQALCR